MMSMQEIEKYTTNLLKLLLEPSKKLVKFCIVGTNILRRRYESQSCVVCSPTLKMKEEDCSVSNFLPAFLLAALPCEPIHAT